MKVLQYLFDLFFKIYALREFYTLSLTICFCLISAEDNPDQKIIDRLKFIRDNTHDKLNIPLSIVELIILTNYSRNIGKEIEFKDNIGRTSTFPLYDVIRYAKESYFELSQFVVKIAKKYSLDIPMKPTTGTIEIPTMPPPDFGGYPAPASAPATQPAPLPAPEEPTIDPDEPIGATTQ